MTRRQRHIRIIENFGLDSQSTRHYRMQLEARRGLQVFTDAAVCELAAMLVAARARQNKTREQNRKRLAA